jgi:hypothetical protein
MATRMQQRRGTAAQWTAANPILAAGEIGFETDTSRFKMGNGSSTWSALTYFANAAELTALLDGAPELLNTLNELAAAVGDDPEFFSTVQDSLDLKAPLASPALTGVPTAPTATSATNTTQIATTEFVQTKINNLVGGAPGLLDTLEELAAALGNDENFASDVANTLTQKASLDQLSDHNSATLDVHGIANTALLVTEAGLSESLTDAIEAHNDLTTGVHGIANTADLATTSDVTTAVGTISTNLTTHADLTLSVHGIADTSLLVTQAQLEDALDTATVDQSTLAGVGIDWNSVDGQFDIDGTIATTAYADQAETDAIAAATSAAATEADSKIATAVGALTKSSVGLANVDNTSDANKPVSTATQTALDLKAPLADPTFTGTVSGVTKSHVGLGSVDNTSDADKPVSTATQTALDLKAPIAAPSFTGDANFEGNVTIEGNLVVEGTTTTVNTSEVQIDDPIFYLSANQYDANTRDIGITGAYGTVGGDEEDHLHTGLVKDVTDGKWKLFSNAPHPVNNVVDFTSADYDTLKVGSLEASSILATSATIGDVSNTELQYLNGVTSAVQTQIDAKSPTNAPTFTGLVTVAASGVAFTDGTQTKEGTPSRTPIVQKSANYTLSALTHRDSLIEVSAAGVITVPTDATLNFPIGTSIDILQTGTGEVSIAPVSVAVTVNATPGRTLRTQWSSATLFKRAANTWVLFGDLK